MPDKATVARAHEDKRQGKAASTQAGEFVKEEMDHIREGVHGARSTKQAIAIGLSKARRAGVDLPPPAGGDTSESARRQATRDLEKGQEAAFASASVGPESMRRSQASSSALQHEGAAAASPRALTRQAHSAANARSPAERSAAAQQASRTRAHDFAGENMSSAKQKSAAKRDVKKAAASAKSKKTIAHLSQATRTALGKQGAKVAKERRAHA